MLSIADLVEIARAVDKCRYAEDRGRFRYDRVKLAAFGVTDEMIEKAEEFRQRYAELDAEVSLAGDGGLIGIRP